ncbi:hypothetical protein BGX29_003415 [Mortierella sp. GBA35]|nr:hypothetical protein BGX29_003415 [Mortierella sp. GBA35]
MGIVRRHSSLKRLQMLQLVPTFSSGAPPSLRELSNCSNLVLSADSSTIALCYARIALPELTSINIDALVRTEWFCINLKELMIHLEVCPRSVAETGLWRSLYEQIGRLTRLECLCLYCDGIKNWSQGQVADLIRAASNLEYLMLSHLSFPQREHITQWLQGTGKPGILA